MVARPTCAPETPPLVQSVRKTARLPKEAPLPVSPHRPMPPFYFGLHDSPDETFQSVNEHSWHHSEKGL